MKRSLLLAQIMSTPWALMPETLNAMAGILRRWRVGDPIPAATLQHIEADQGVRTARKAANTQAGSGQIAVLPLYGIITQRGNMVDALSGPGSCSTQQFAASLTDALNDPAVEQILIDIDSPGGSVYGVEELAAQILAARGQKPVVAVANSLAASAAYWIGSAASEFYCTPGGEVGSIGVWQAHEDLSDALKYEGIDVTLISAGKFKVEGNPYEPLTAEATAFLQSRVDDYFNAFVAAVAQARAVNADEVINGMGQGRVLGASAALSLNMIDGILTFDQVVSLMQSRIKPKASRLSQARNSLALM
ncbi:S49 family peptidase [Ferrovum sp.]|uniref:S49 family peptidase n=1 Tax=Ferrovum sp. TaxID=2609467 RepID=UPI0026159F61|nr:S49 family peptidase [Ferrovum sp.]